MAPPLFFDPLIFGTELVFTIIAVVFCFLIYSRTRESYVLTKHKGIKYFRDAFLFFGLSYLLRFLFSLLLLSGATFDFILPRGMFAFFFILPLGYFSTIGIFYLIFSSIWKRFNNKIMLIFGHSTAIVLSLISFITRSHLMLIGLQCALLLLVVLLSFMAHRGEKKISQIKILYLLVSALWLINLLVIDQKRPFPLEMEIFFQVVSLIVFVIIYYRISKWAR